MLLCLRVSVGHSTSNLAMTSLTGTSLSCGKGLSACSAACSRLPDLTSTRRVLHLAIANTCRCAKPASKRLTISFDPESLRVTLNADSDPGFVISDIDLP